MNVHVYVNNVLWQDLRVRQVRASYVRPWEAELAAAGRHDCPPALGLNDLVRIRDPITGRTLFRGNVVEMTPGGLAQEGCSWRCYDKRWRLENEPVRISGRGFYCWNRRGTVCDEGEGGEDSPGRDGGKWTAGEIIIDILEHALGLPHGGSHIPGHHGVAGCCTDTFLTSDDVSGYTAADILALDSVVGEFSVDGTSVADAISMLLALNGGFYGWYIDPDTGRLEVRDLDALPETDIEAGELGQWQDAAGTNYALLNNQLVWSLDGVCSTLIIQGTDGTTEEEPANIEGTANAGLGDFGELELVAAPWRGFDAAYRPRFQPKRMMTDKPIDATFAYTPPAGYLNYGNGPRVYRGKAAGAKSIYIPPSGFHPRYLLPSGMIVFREDPRTILGYQEKLWGWYWAFVPFVVTAGPDGDAYHWYGYERTRTIYDTAFRSVTGWPQPGTADDATAMGILAARLLRLYRDVRRQGTLICDQVDFDAYDLGRRYSVRNLGCGAVAGPSTTPGPTTTTLMGGYRDPARWDTLRINAVDLVYDFDRDATEITVANTFWMLEEYSALKQRLETNLFAQRALRLSETVYACQVAETQSVPHEDEPPASGCTNIIGMAAETDAAQTDQWAFNKDCVKVTMLTRMAYNHAGDKKLYGYYRTFEWNEKHELVAVSAETRVEIDAPEACP